MGYYIPTLFMQLAIKIGIRFLAAGARGVTRGWRPRRLRPSLSLFHIVFGQAADCLSGQNHRASLFFHGEILSAGWLWTLVAECRGALLHR